MKIPSLLLLIASLFALPSAAQVADTLAKQTTSIKTDTVKITPLPEMLASSQGVANYKINANLNHNDHVIDGNMELTWLNYSTDTIKELQFHMYLNAFKNSKSTLFREKTGQISHSETSNEYPKKWGYVNIISMKVVGGDVLTDRITFIQPDDNNTDDQTVASVALTKPLLPGQSILLKINFESGLPSLIQRSGFVDKFFMVAQWFPKLGVYEPKGWRNATKGQWNCHQYHNNSEFYANFGNYEVNITVPKEYKVGATGKQINKPDLSNNVVTYNFQAKDVIDFAWTASANFLELEEVWEHVTLKLLIQPEHKGVADRYFESAKATLSLLKQELGEYPYETLTLVDPPSNAPKAGGMEYPNLVTVADKTHLSSNLQFWEKYSYGLIGRPSKHIRMLEQVTVHEIIHQYFMGLLASNEFEEAWLDEGFTKYWETRVMDKTYGNGSILDMPNLKVSDMEYARSKYFDMDHPYIAETYRNSWEFTEGGYNELTYSKTCTWLYTLHNLVGEQTMSEIWKTYYAKFRFKHPTAKDFISIANESIIKHHGQKFGPNIFWFFDQFLFGTKQCDYAVLGIINGNSIPDVGIFDKEGGKKEIPNEAKKQNTETIHSRVALQRIGDAILPVEVLVHFEDGTEERVIWNGQSRTANIWFTEKNSKVSWAKIDPDNKITIDGNRINNVISVSPSPAPFLKYSLKLSFWFQNVLEFFALFV